jgi:transcriptional regulator GlxA family with amidase domain
MTRTVAFFLFDDFQFLDAAGPITVFEIASRFSAGEAYRIVLTGKEPGRARASSGVELAVEALSGVETIDTLMVAGGLGTRTAMACDRTLQSLREANRRARRLCSVCSGAFVLAAAGLLDGLSVTTHWRNAASFARSFPKVQMRADRIYVRQGRVWTSAGVSAGIDLALALTAEDLGDEIAKRTAREMVVYYRRPGAQSQFSALLDMDSPDHRFSALLDAVRSRLDHRWTVETLADEMCMSPRHFSRAFAAATGMSPAKAVERLRLEAARERVEAGVEPIEIVAAKAGFGDPERMRRAFVQTFGLPPQGLRRQARAKTSSL